MTNKEKRTLIAKIHIAKKDLAMDDDTYRDVLHRVTGKNSCKDMTLNELKAVIKDLKRLGFTVKTVQSKPKHGTKPTTTPEREAMLGKIEAMLADMNLHWNYVHAMSKNMFGVDFVHWLDAQKTHKVVQALAVYQNRKAKEQETGQ